ncbi:MAG: hypothetical protein JST19_14125 [Bacteroidetes bacterium]|nr:hypothetical protein [Bacteroidota bacterium]
MKIDSAKTKQEIIALIHSALRSLIPTNKLDRIGQAILNKILIDRKEALRDPLDVPVDYTYNASDNTITRIEIDNEIYDVNKP